jgi:ATP-dependent Lhr-like helicase
LITSDSFQGLRFLVTPQKILHRRHHRYPHHDPLAATGRWSLLRPYEHPANDRYESIAHIARVLLLRYGVVFRKVLEREDAIPSWRELLYVYRRLEARGEIRGGRFVQGFAGEQFALPEALNLLTVTRNLPKTAELTVLSAADPLNLTGIITPGERIASSSRQRLVYRDGLPMAHGSAKQIHYLDTFNPDHQWQLRWALIKR